MAAGRISSGVLRLLVWPRFLEIKPSTPALRSAFSRRSAWRPAHTVNSGGRLSRDPLRVQIAHHLQMNQLLVAHDTIRHPRALQPKAGRVSSQSVRLVTSLTVIYTVFSYKNDYVKYMRSYLYISICYSIPYHSGSFGTTGFSWAKCPNFVLSNSICHDNVWR
jgi:hypothetical protein